MRALKSAEKASQHLPTEDEIELTSKEIQYVSESELLMVKRMAQAEAFYKKMRVAQAESESLKLENCKLMLENEQIRKQINWTNIKSDSLATNVEREAELMKHRIKQLEENCQQLEIQVLQKDT